MNKKKSFEAQILIIMLIALAIISVFVIIIATNARRDFIETIQNKQYEQAIAIGESKLILYANGQMQEDLDSGAARLDISTGTPRYIYDDFFPDSTSEDKMIIVLYEEEHKTIDDYPLEKDRSITIRLTETTDTSPDTYYEESLDFNWTGDSTSLEFNVDYVTTGNEYKTIKGIANTEIFSNPLTTLTFTDVGNHAVSLNLANMPADVKKLLAVRVKALMTETDIITTFSMKPSHGSNTINLPNQTLIVIAETYSISPGQTDTPVAILELQKPLHNSAIELFDYVLRSQGQIVKTYQ